MTDIERLSLAREQAAAAFAAACQQLSYAQKAVHASRNKLKVAQRRYIESLEERRAA